MRADPDMTYVGILRIRRQRQSREVRRHYNQLKSDELFRGTFADNRSCIQKSLKSESKRVQRCEEAGQVLNDADLIHGRTNAGKMR